jgi:hypothetical protein
MEYNRPRALHFRTMTHFFDIAAGVLMRFGPARSRIFPDGWGDQETLDTLSDPSALRDAVPEVDIVWGRKEEHRGHRITRGQFVSPSAALLPPEARVVVFEQMEPPSGTAPLVTLLPAWNDHGFSQRRTIASLLLDHGIGSLIFDVPLYGSRRVTNEREQAIRTVADFMLMGFGGIRDALAMSLTIDRAHGFAGFSMGGNLAALAAAASPKPVAMAGMAASHSPGPVYLDGVLSNAIEWEALGGRDAEPRLRALLTTASALAYDPEPHLRSAVLLAAEGDGFVPFDAAKALADHWNAELRTLPGGHATALWRHRPTFARAIADASGRLDALDA